MNGRGTEPAARLCFAEMIFDAELLWAARPRGRRVRFTRSERAVLAALIRNAHRIMTRNQLLDAISGVGSDAAERSIDFLINRLRGKLGDDARRPRFIATQYGEGYVWIAEPRKEKADGKPPKAKTGANGAA
ncbi:winged helix-turn-helix domain-containing protein [Starkeya sp. 3C]|uniref:Winged helix-turn-helix domain-containing protein n=1 Tax=Ancylobacter moscoviensis TaxID=2597768 RepID=A0ABY3DNN6_9HYPH|nr:helix-turn-helix domain-containing protein [Ancylobacter moscoviensis]TSJ61055.1 winged helix-turn-helix domain-containing protein [Ancylobacter moscoviensis]